MSNNIDLRIVRGMKDFSIAKYANFQFIIDVISNISNKYGFAQIDTPILEYTNVFSKTLGDTSDIVVEEMYSFIDKGGNSVTMRPEFTAAVVRHMINTQYHIPIKLFSVGPLFRYDRPQKGRYRQFHQANFEYLGNEHYTVDVELINIANQILNSLNVTDITLEINSLGSDTTKRKYNNELQKYFSQYTAKLSSSACSKIDTNPLRIFDSKNTNDQEICKEAPKIYEYYSEQDRESFEKLQDLLIKIGIKFTINPYLVRGLDYYTNTIFEFKTTHLGAQDAVISGGRYDLLMKKMSNNKYDISSSGFAIGIERLLELTEYKKPRKRNIGIIALESNTKIFQYIFDLMNKIPADNLILHTDFRPDVKLKKKIQKFEKNNIINIIFIGENEVDERKYTIKDLTTGIENKYHFTQLLDAIINLKY